jgi:hypothetical protein
MKKPAKKKRKYTPRKPKDVQPGTTPGNPENVNAEENTQEVKLSITGIRLFKEFLAAKKTAYERGIKDIDDTLSELPE